MAKFDLVSWALQQIAGQSDFDGPIIVRHRHGGICSTTPRLQASKSKKQKITAALRPFLPVADKIVETTFNLNKGNYNPR